MNDCIFCKIRDREIAKEFTYEDEDIMVFPDIHPIASVHLLIMPKKHIEDFLMISDESLMMKLTKIVQEMIKKSKLEKRGYKLFINGGGAQIIDHLHIHLIGPIGKNVKL